jgi:hypothetical protein
LKVHGIELYPAAELAKVAAMRADAARGLGGVSTGLGFIGSPGWVIGASAALGFLESALSEASKKSAIRLLAQAEEIAAAVRARGLLFRIEDIEQIDRPSPSAWMGNSIASQPVYTGAMKHYDLEDFLFKHGKRRADIIDNYVSVPVKQAFAHTGEDFVVVDTELGLMNIRWSSVVGYVAPSRTYGNSLRGPSSGSQLQFLAKT